MKLHLVALNRFKDPGGAGDFSPVLGKGLDDRPLKAELLVQYQEQIKEEEC